MYPSIIIGTYLPVLKLMTSIITPDSTLMMMWKILLLHHFVFCHLSTSINHYIRIMIPPQRNPVRETRIPIRYYVAVLTALFLLVCWIDGATAFSSPASTRSDVTTTPSQQQQQQGWKPIVASLEERRYLRGLQHNSETIGSLGFHHIEFYCGDAKNTALRFALALGMHITGMTGQSTGNDKCVSYGLVSGNVRLLLTAPYSQVAASSTTTTFFTNSANTANTCLETAPHPLPNFSPPEAHIFFQKHGLAVRALCIEVKDAEDAYQASIARGAKSVLEPTWIPTCVGQQQQQQQVIPGERVGSVTWQKWNSMAMWSCDMLVFRINQPRRATLGFLFCRIWRQLAITRQIDQRLVFIK
jgi:hypothetical protein